MNLGKGAYYHADDTVELDQYFAGFWLGSQGTVQAQRQAADAIGGEEGAGA